MKQSFLFFILLLVSCKSETKSTSDEPSNSVVEVRKDVEEETYSFPVYNYEQLSSLLNASDDKVHIINFWATWCAPCIKELPDFEKIAENYKDQDVELLLVSLDFPRQYKTKLEPFLIEKDIKAKVVALNDLDMDTWIPAIDSTWSGAIPATLIYTKNKRKFYEQSFDYVTLEAEVTDFLNN